METYLFSFFTGWLLCAAAMLGLYFLQRKWNDAGIVDVAWAYLLGVLAIWYVATAETFQIRHGLLLFLACLWSFRLGTYLLFNRVIGKEEDGRYKSLRESYGDRAQSFFFWFFQAQAGFCMLFSIPFLAVLSNPVPGITHWDIIGVCAGLLAVAGEALSDRQLADFRARPGNKGKTCREGLWRYSRHPNYFFEWLHWWAYFFLSLGSRHAWLSLLGPVAMYIFLFRVTGIPYTEKQAVASRGDDYREYQRATSVFIPWFPRKGD